MTSGFELSKYYKDQTETPFIDENFLSQVTLDQGSIMEYFYLSHFFETNSINHRCRVQKVEFHKKKELFTGIEYNLQSTTNPFLISKDIRKNANEVVTISYYYCCDGIIYQAPDLLSVLTSGVQTIGAECLEVLNHINSSNS